MKYWPLALLIVISFSEPSFAGVNCNYENPGPVNFSLLEQLVNKCRIKKIEQLLPLLPKEYARHYVLVHTSRSIQGASADFPRVIMYGGDSRFLMAFNGSPHQARYSALETIEYNSDQHTFEMRFIEFPETNEKQTARISETNPQLCLSCHGSSPRPIWDAYFFWPGVYQSESGNYRLELSPRETEMFQGFLKNLKTPRYSKLPIYDPTLAAPTEMGFQLESLNREVISQEIANTPQLYPYRFALVAATQCNVADFELFLPDHVRALLKRPLIEVMAETRQLNSEDLKGRVARHIASTGVEPEGGRVMEQIQSGGGTTGLPQVNALFRYLVEGLGLPMHWSLDFKSEHYAFNDRGDGLNSLKPYLLKQLFSGEERALYNASQDQCAFLKEKSLFSLKSASHYLEPALRRSR